MKKYEFAEIRIDTGKMISTQIADQMTPIFFNRKENLQTRILDIKFYYLWHKMIMDLGEQEHTNDWDPYCTIQLYDGTTFGNESGFWVLEISGDNLLLEHPNEDGESPDQDEDCYHAIPIMEIESIQFSY